MKIVPKGRSARPAASRAFLRGFLPGMFALVLLIAGLLPAAAADELSAAKAASAPATKASATDIKVPVKDDHKGDDTGPLPGVLQLGLGLCVDGLICTADPIGTEGDLDKTGGVAIGGDGGDGSVVGVGLGLCLLTLVACDQVGQDNFEGGDGGDAKAKGNKKGFAVGGDGGDGGPVTIGVGICALIASCDDVGTGNGQGGDGGDAKVKGKGKRKGGNGYAKGGDGGDGGGIVAGVGVCAIIVKCDDVGSDNGDGGDGGNAFVIGRGKGNGTAIAGDGGDGGPLAVGAGLCLLISSCGDAGSDNGQGGDGGKSLVAGKGKRGDHGIAIGGDGGKGGLALGIGACALNLLLISLQECDDTDLGSGNGNGGDGGDACALRGGSDAKTRKVCRDFFKDGKVPDDDDDGKDDDDDDGKDKDDDEDGGLADTGSSTTSVLIIGLVTLLLGVGLVGAARRFDRRGSSV